MSNPVNYNSRFHSKGVLNPLREPVSPTEHTENKVKAMGPRLSKVCDPKLRENPRFASVRAPSPKRAAVKITIREEEFDYINDDENDSMAIAKIRDLLAELLEGPATELPTKTESAMTF